MPYELSEDASNQPDGPWDPPDIPLDYSQGNPFGPLNAPLDPIEDPSNVAVDPMEHLNIWDPEGLPLDPHRDCSPNP